MSKILLCVLKRMAKNPNIRKTDIWMGSETQMVSILNRSSRKQKMEDHFKNATKDNDFHTEIHSWVSWFSNLTFQKTIFLHKSNKLFYVSIIRVIETEYAMKFPSTLWAYYFCLSFLWDWLCAFYLQIMLAMKKRL